MSGVYGLIRCYSVDVAGQPSKIETDLIDFFEELEEITGKGVSAGVKLLPDGPDRVQITVYQDSGDVSEIFTFPNGLDDTARERVEEWLEFYYEDSEPPIN
jgi:hypothetical protein